MNVFDRWCVEILQESDPKPKERIYHSIRIPLPKQVGKVIPPKRGKGSEYKREKGKWEKLYQEAFRNIHDISGSAFSRGQSGEWEFSECMKANGFQVREATKQEEIQDHFDFRVFEKKLDQKGHLIPAWKTLPENQGLREPHKVEVKGLKRIGPQNSVLLEIIGIAGYPGWLYGYSNYLAFQTDPNTFKLFKTFKVRPIVERIVGYKLMIPVGGKASMTPTEPGKKFEFVDADHLALAPKLYSRKDPGNHDVITRIPLAILESYLTPLVYHIDGG